MLDRLFRCVSVAFVMLAPGALLLAQHGSVGSMSSAHFGGAVHAGPSLSFSGASRTFAPPSRPYFSSPLAPRQAVQPGHGPSSSRYLSPYRSPYSSNNRRRGVGYRGPYLYAGYPWLNSFGLGYPFGYGFPYGDDEDSAQPAGQPAMDYGPEYAPDYGPEPPNPQMAENASTPYRPAYQGQTDTATVSPQPATILIFQDGRPPLKVHNYAITAATLYVLDGDSRQDIPLAQLNVPATVEANRAAGVDFAPPTSRDM
jgi:hypothetical protein